MRMHIKHIMAILVTFLLYSILSGQFAHSRINPASSYCNSLGYKYIDGKCVISDTEEVDAWDFIKGKAAQEHSFCAKQGYEIRTIKDREKCAIYGRCVISDTEEVDAWDFIKGKAAQEHSFCAKQGYEIRTIKDREKCAIYGTEECAVCVLPGEEKEVSEFMNISFVE